MSSNLDQANPYRAPTAPIEPLTAAQSLVKAERGTRFVAVLIDGLISLAALIPGVIGMMMPQPDQQLTGFGIALIALSAVASIALLAYNLMLLHRQGQTIGKRSMRARIVRADGSRAGLGRIFGLRMLLPGVIGAIPILGPLFTLVDPLFIFAEDKRCLHDKIADTIVVNA